MHLRSRLITLLLILYSACSFAQTEKYEFPKLITKLEIVQGYGNIRITSSSNSGTTSVSINKAVTKSSCKYNVNLSDSTLSIELVTEGTTRMADCQADMVLALANPEDISADLDLENGKIEMSGFAGTLDLKVNRGDVSILDSYIEKVDGKIQRGDLSIRGKIGPGAFTVTEGNIFCSFKQHPPMGQLSLKAERGNIDIEMPFESDLSAQSSLGSPQSSQAQSITGGTGVKGSTFSMSFFHPRGNLSIKRR